MEPKRVLLLNASHNDERLLFALKRLGCYVITTGNRPNLEGHKFADEYVFGDYSNLEEMVNIAIEKKIDAVCPCCNDFGVKTAAYISEKLGFQGQDSYETTLTIHDKAKFKEFAKKIGGINTPAALSFNSLKEALEWAESNKDYPVIVKAADLSAGNGINRANDLEELKMNINTAFSYSREEEIVVEPFVEGPLNGFCTFLINQKVAAYSSDNEYCIVNPYRVDSFSLPSYYIDEVKDDLIQQIERIASALQLTDGIFHLQFIYNNGKAHIIECMRRVLGNMYSVAASNYNEGFDWDYWEARAKCGFGCKGFPQKVGHYGFWGAKAMLAKENGVFKKCRVPNEAERKIYFVKNLHEPGYIIHDYKSDPVSLLFEELDSVSEINHFILELHDKYEPVVSK